MERLLKGTGILTLAVSGLVFWMFMTARQRNVRLHKMDIAGGAQRQEKLSVFFISDIHRRVIDNRLIKKIKKHGDIDVVVIGGDLAENGVPIKRVQQNVKNLAVLGKAVFYIWGNNDREVGEGAIRQIFESCNGHILDNENAPIPGHPDWIIAGTDDPSSKNVDIIAALRGLDQEKYSLWVTHTPSLFRKVREQTNPTVLLAGHTHGGQIRLGPFGLQDKGAFTLNGQTAQLISNGYGTSMLPLRFGAPPECHILHIHYEPKDGN